MQLIIAGFLVGVGPVYTVARGCPYEGGEGFNKWVEPRGAPPPTHIGPGLYNLI